MKQVDVVPSIDWALINFSDRFFLNCVVIKCMLFLSAVEWQWLSSWNVQMVAVDIVGHGHGHAAWILYELMDLML